MKYFILLCIFLSGCQSLPGTSVVSARNAALALSACQPLGAEPRYIFSIPLKNGDVRMEVECTSDIEVKFIVKKPKPDVKDI